MRNLLVPCLLVVSLTLAACGGSSKTTHESHADPIAALEGGEPLPDGALTIGFPWIGKQSIMCIGDAVERQIAFVDFTDGTPGKVGTVEVSDAKSANRQTRRPSTKERRSPKTRVITAMTMRGTSVPVMACRSATFAPIMARKSFHSTNPMATAKRRLTGPW